MDSHVNLRENSFDWNTRPLVLILKVKIDLREPLQGKGCKLCNLLIVKI